MCRQDRRGVHDGVPEGLGLVPHLGGNPHRRQAEGGLHGGNADDLLLGGSSVHGEIMVGKKLSPSRFGSLDPQDVLRGLDLDVVPDADGRDDEAELHGHLFSDGSYAVQHVPSLPRIHERDDGVPDFRFHGIHGQEAHDILGGRRRRSRFRSFSRSARRLGFPSLTALLPSSRFLNFSFPVDPVAHEGQETGEKKEGDGGQPGHNGQGKEQHGPDEEGAGIIGQGCENIPAQVRLPRRPGDDDAGGG
ncbi:hypothetical protein SDC9_120461 [bioreactor metagenome]|uniref:Uncharacterized protein n=1 Tax=bioreactor metagenome TaxID=1076179 RepID=A0A645C889_9ZZZZ